MSYQVHGDWGNVWVGLNPTPGSGVHYSQAPSSFSDSNAIIVLQNISPNWGSGQLNTSVRLYPDYVKLICTGVPAGGAGLQAALTLDTVLGRLGSGGTVIGLVSPTVGVVPVPNGKLVYGPTLNPMSSSGRLIGRESVRQTTPNVGDEYLFAFGTHTKAVSGEVLNGTNPQKLLCVLPPVSIPPQGTLALHLWWTGSSGSSSSASASSPPGFEFEVSWIER